MTIRQVKVEDAPAIARIYNHYIATSIATFEEQPVSESEIAQRITKTLALNYPYIVCVENLEIIGYAYANVWRNRSAFDITLETSVYIEPHQTGKSIGHLLYDELIKKSREIGIHSLIGVISIPNEASRKLHQKFQFCLVGTFREVGKKFGKLIDVEFWQLIL